MTNPLDDSRYLIERAKKHIRDLEGEIAAWVNSKPYSEVVETNADSTEDTYKIKLNKPMPSALPGIAFDAIGNLRAALDQAGFAVAVAAGSSGKNAHFPFGDTLAEAENRRTGGSSDIPKPIFDVMIALRPYQAGNLPLWAMNKLSNTNKHEIILPIGIGTGAMHIRHVHFTKIINMGGGWPPQWDTTKNEVIWACVPRGEKPSYEFKIHILVVVGNIKGIPRSEAVGAFNAMAAEVERSIMAIGAEARRIGLFHYDPSSTLAITRGRG